MISSNFAFAYLHPRLNGLMTLLPRHHVQATVRWRIGLQLKPYAGLVNISSARHYCCANHVHLCRHAKVIADTNGARADCIKNVGSKNHILTTVTANAPAITSKLRYHVTLENDQIANEIVPQKMTPRITLKKSAPHLPRKTFGRTIGGARQTDEYIPT